jgi:phenylalanyl-tRNA synthetase beta chain
MKISYNWLKQFLDINHPPEYISTLLTGCGLEVEHLESWKSIKGGLEGLYVAHVVSCEKHPNADKLSITQVDVADGIIRQIVCGAPNVAAGQKVIVALPGAELYPSVGESFTIKKSKIRGEVSDGMICAEDEIGLGASHAGIMILPEDTIVGTKAADFFGMEEDHVFEIGLTPNRADAASHLGVARDLVALLGTESKQNLITKIDNLKVENISCPIEVVIDEPESCKRYSGYFIKGVSVNESPTWLKNRLLSIGVRPVNNVVDATNYILHDMGQPIHAFDASKITNNKIRVGKLHTGTTFITLDGNERKLNGSELMINDAQGGLCIAGVFGGINSGVTLATTDLFIESACFNSVYVRKSAKAHGLHTDSSFRFERGTDPEMTVGALNKVTALIIELAGGKVEGGLLDIYPQPVEWAKIKLTFAYLNTLIGAKIPLDSVKRILVDLQIKITNEDAESLSLEIPPFKVEVTRPADVVEEILRIYGYNAIELPKKMALSIAPIEVVNREEINFTLSSWLVNNGFNEILNNSLTKVKTLELIPVEDGREAVPILNPLSSDLGILRHNMLANGLESILYNINRRQKDLRFFELGKTYHKLDGKYSEQYHLSLYTTGNRISEHWKLKSNPYDLYSMKAVVMALLESVGIKVNAQISISENSDALMEQSITLSIKKHTIAVVGNVKKELLKQFDLSQPIWYADINLDALMKCVPSKDPRVPEPPKFPEVRRDLSMVLDRSILYSDIQKLVLQAEPKLLKSVNAFDVYEGEKIEAGKKSYALSFILQDENSTLTDKQIDGVMDKLMNQLEQKLGAQIRK